jgi:hypothetical protein
MSSIENTTFFDSHYIEFIRNLINKGSKKSAINSNEISFAKDQDLIRQINDEMQDQSETTLLLELVKYKEFISIPDAVYFLVDTVKQHGESVDAINILDLLVKDQYTATASELMLILRESENMPPGWASSLYAKSSIGRNANSEIVMKSGLNLEAMRDFK